MELFFGLILSFTAAVVGVWHIASRDRDRPIHGPRDDGTLGLPHLQRWSEKQPDRRFESVRRNLPLVELSRIVLGVLIVLVFAGVALGGIAIYRVINERSNAQMASQYEDVVELRQRAATADTNSGQYELLTEARDAAESLLTESSDDDIRARLVEERAAIQAALDELTRTVRIDRLQLVGAVPAHESERTPRLVSGGGNIYLLSDAFYQVDVASRTLVRLLAPGEEVAGIPVGTLVDASWRDDGPTLVDDRNAFVYDVRRGVWDLEELGTSDVGSGLGPATVAVDAYDRNLYAVDRGIGRILKFDAGDYQRGPSDWSAGAGAESLTAAVDMIVDGSIFVLLSDGRVVHFFLNAVQAVYEPEVIPPLESAEALFSDAEGRLYIVDGTSQRVVVIDRTGALIRQIAFGPDVDLRGDLLDIDVEASTGIAYLLTTEALYTTRLPNLPSDIEQ